MIISSFTINEELPWIPACISWLHSTFNTVVIAAHFHYGLRLKLHLDGTQKSFECSRCTRYFPPAMLAAEPKKLSFIQNKPVIIGVLSKPMLIWSQQILSVVWFPRCHGQLKRLMLFWLCSSIKTNSVKIFIKCSLYFQILVPRNSSAGCLHLFVLSVQTLSPSNVWKKIC